MKVLPADVRTAKSLAKALFRQLDLQPEIPKVSLQQCHELYAKCLGYTSWFELATLLKHPHAPLYLGDLPEEVRVLAEGVIWGRLTTLLGLDIYPGFALDAARLAGLGYSPQDAAKFKRLITPWGPAEHNELVAPGIQRISTAGHGGYRLSLMRQRQLQEILGETAEWFEEDEEAAIVEAAFPDAFDADKASRRLYTTFPELFTRIYGATPEVYVQGRRERLLQSFRSAPESWFIVDSVGQLPPGVGGPWFVFYALRGQSALRWFLDGIETAGRSGKLFVAIAPEKDWHPSMTISLGDEVSPALLALPVEDESAVGNLDMRHIQLPDIAARFVRRAVKLEDLVTGSA